MSGGGEKFVCGLCSASFSRKDSLLRHQKLPHNNSFTCNICEKRYTKEFFYKKHMIEKHSVNFEEVPRKKIRRENLPSTSTSSETNNRVEKFDLETKIYDLQRQIKDLSEQISLANLTKNVNTNTNRREEEEISEIVQILENVEENCDHEIYKLCTCGKNVSEKNLESHLMTQNHRKNFIKTEKFKNEVKLFESAYHCEFVSYKISEDKYPDEIDIDSYITRLIDEIKKLIEFEMHTRKIAKIQINIFAFYEDPIKLLMSEETDDVNAITSIQHQTKYEVFSYGDNIDEFIKKVIETFEQKIDEFEGNGSGLVMSGVEYLTLNITSYNPLKGGSSFIDLPEVIKRKNAIINPENHDNDNLCFLYAVLAKKHEPLFHKSNVNHYIPHLNTLKYQNLQFPLNVNGIRKFEKQNTSLSVNVFELVKKQKKKKITIRNENGFETKEIDDFSVKIFYVTKQEKLHNHVNLLLIHDGKKSHYCYIKNLSALVGSQISKDKRKKHICNSCFSMFRSEDLRQNHVTSGCCMRRKVIYPMKGENEMKFKNFHRKTTCRFSIYADFESVLEPVESPFNDENVKSYTTQLHKPCSFGYKIVYNASIGNDESLNSLRLYRGLDAGEKFIENIRKDVEYIWQNYKHKNTPMKITNDEENRFQQTTHCYLCEREFKDIDKCGPIQKHSRVRDHDHLTGENDTFMILINSN